jgi:hypothetical protein
MRISFLLTVAYLIATVFAGGYQGCLERVLLFYAYQIDQLNPLEEQTLGWRCRRWRGRDRTNYIPAHCDDDDWERCRGAGGGKCSFNELMVFLGKLRQNDQVVGPPGADQDTTTPDIRTTAIRLYQ